MELHHQEKSAKSEKMAVTLDLIMGFHNPGFRMSESCLLWYVFCNMSSSNRLCSGASDCTKLARAQAGSGWTHLEHIDQFWSMFSHVFVCWHIYIVFYLLFKCLSILEWSKLTTVWADSNQNKLSGLARLGNKLKILAWLGLGSNFIGISKLIWGNRIYELGLVWAHKQLRVWAGLVLGLGKRFICSIHPFNGGV